jgi:hypothetical protein
VIEGPRSRDTRSTESFTSLVDVAVAINIAWACGSLVSTMCASDNWFLISFSSIPCRGIVPKWINRRETYRSESRARTLYRFSDCLSALIVRRAEAKSTQRRNIGPFLRCKHRILVRPNSFRHLNAINKLTGQSLGSSRSVALSRTRRCEPASDSPKTFRLLRRCSLVGLS